MLARDAALITANSDSLQAMAAEPTDVETLRKHIEAFETGTYKRDEKPGDAQTTHQTRLQRGSSLRRSPLQRKAPLRRIPKTK
jgi:hypothetical protein